MSNEVLIILSIVICFSGVLAAYYFFGRAGLMCYAVLCSIAANIEVLITVDAFGLEQTLGNVIFASTFLVTDIMSEIYGKKAATKTVYLGSSAVAFFVIISQLWLQFTPSASDWVMPSIQSIFSTTPRLMFSSLMVYLICQRLDVWLYHFWWSVTSKNGDKKRGLWLRNNGSTLISQLFNAILFNVFAFYGVFDGETLISIIISSYLIFLVIGIFDTPIVYIARKIKPREA